MLTAGGPDFALYLCQFSGELLSRFLIIRLREGSAQKMGKVERPKKGGAASSSPYDRKASTAKSTSQTKNNVFKFNKDFGQHILKNPGVAEG